MDLVARLDDYGKLAWLLVMVLGFVVFWPIGLAILAYLIWSGRMGCSRSEWRRESAGGFGGKAGGGFMSHLRGRHAGRRQATSGNSAFDEYREETLRRLEEEQGEFHEFLERLRRAKDKAEFDQFMADRRRPRDTGSEQGRDQGRDQGPAPAGGPLPQPLG